MSLPATRYQATRFLLSVNQLSQLPPDQGREVALVGRSNAGKSSALNRLTGQKKLARISKTPGRTQMINYFEVAPEQYLVDLPGYGYAKVPEAMRKHWRKTLHNYFSQRQSLCGLLLIMDSRHPLTELDQQMLSWCAAKPLPVLILLTKVDKLKRGAALNTLQKVRKQTNARAILFSALTGQGMDEALHQLDDWFMEPSNLSDTLEY